MFALCTRACLSASDAPVFAVRGFAKKHVGKLIAREGFTVAWKREREREIRQIKLDYLVIKSSKFCNSSRRGSHAFF